MTEIYVPSPSITQLGRAFAEQAHAAGWSVELKLIRPGEEHHIKIDPANIAWIKEKESWENK